MARRTVPSPSQDKPRRVPVAAGVAGLVAGLALGVTGLASAAGWLSTSQSSDSAHQLAAGHQPAKPVTGVRGGLVTAVSSHAVTLNTSSGRTTFALTGSTRYFDGRAKATQGALAVGEIVAVRPVDPRTAPRVAKDVEVLPAHIDGWVSKVRGSTIALTDTAGFTRTVTTSSATTYLKDNAPGSAADVTTGTFVRALGKVASDGTTLAATQVATGRPARAGAGQQAASPGP